VRRIGTALFALPCVLSPLRLRWCSVPAPLARIHCAEPLLAGVTGAVVAGLIRAAVGAGTGAFVGSR
jgi:hypothetical protein